MNLTPEWAGILTALGASLIAALGAWRGKKLELGPKNIEAAMEIMDRLEKDIERLNLQVRASREENHRLAEALTAANIRLQELAGELESLRRSQRTYKENERRDRAKMAALEAREAAALERINVLEARVAELEDENRRLRNTPRG